MLVDAGKEAPLHGVYFARSVENVLWRFFKMQLDREQTWIKKVT